MSLLRQAEGNWIALRTDANRAAEALARWKLQKPFDGGDHFEKRLRLDGLTEENLLEILGLPAEVYSDLIPTPPEWVRVLRRLYSTACHPVPDDDQQFLQWARQGTNAFLWIAYPIIQEGVRRFEEAVRRLPAAGTLFDAASVARLALPNLFEMLQPAVEYLMVLKLNIARLRGLLKGELPEERFRNFCDTLRHPEVRWSIIREYPVLFRSLHIRTMNWVDYSLELLSRLSSDWDLIRANLEPGMEPGSLTAIRAGAGDNHRRGRTVAILEFSSGWKLVYKPHSLSLDVHFGDLLEWLNQNGFQPGFRTLRIIDRRRYGWSEFAAHQPCCSAGEVERFYQRLGGLLAVFHILKATDMHFDNLVADGEFPVSVDLETLFHPVVEEGEDPAVGAWQSSVLSVLLLPSRILGSETQEGIDVSGLGAKSGQYLPPGSVTSWEATQTDEMRSVRDKAVPMNVSGNRPRLNGQEVSAEDFLEPFVTGFTRVYGLIKEHREELQNPGGILDRFAEDEVRFIARPTRAYFMLLTKAFHPDMLRNAIDQDQLFDGLWLSASVVPSLARLIPAELNDLHNGDIPVFTTRPNSRDLWSSDGDRIPEVFEQTVIDKVRQTLRQFGDEDLALQTWFIRAAIGSAGEGVLRASKPRKLRSDAQDPIKLAQVVGDELCREALEYDSYVSWIGLTPVGPSQVSWSLQPLDAGFHAGLSGCSFFLAYLGALTGEQSYSRIARKAINLVRRQLERARVGGLPMRSLGGFSGSGGIIYTLAHLAALWQDASLIAEAESLADDVPLLIESDGILDVIAGCAGCIAALVALNTVSPSDRLLDAALLCGERLLRQQQPQETGVGWNTVISTQPLTGFGHGAAGIAWALLKLAAWSKDPRFRAAAEAAIAYERSTFVAEESNWPDFRKRDLGPAEGPSKPRFSVGWCHGAPGIALARIDGLPYLDDRETREEIRIALRKTAESGFGPKYCLCHGNLGNLEVLTYAAQKMGEPWINDVAARLATDLLPRIAEGEFSGDAEATGMMVGLAGIGYGLLRLACPQRIPSVMVLAPPPTGVPPGPTICHHMPLDNAAFYRVKTTTCPR